MAAQGVINMLQKNKHIGNVNVSEMYHVNVEETKLINDVNKNIYFYIFPNKNIKITMYIVKTPLYPSWITGPSAFFCFSHP